MDKQGGSDKENGTDTVRVSVDPGICGFDCLINGEERGGMVRFDIQSECQQVKGLAARVGNISMKDLFVPRNTSPVFVAAQESGCHHACPIPSSLVKAAEVALGLALPKEVTLRFLK